MTQWLFKCAKCGHKQTHDSHWGPKHMGRSCDKCGGDVRLNKDKP